MKAWIGKSLIAIGIIHCTFGFVFGQKTLRVLVSEGIFNTVNGQPNREAFFWFLFTGFLMLILGSLVNWMEKNNIRTPSLLLWSLIAITVIALVIMPKSGGWLFLIPITGLIVRYRSKPDKN